MIYSTKILSQTIVELCRIKGIDHIVISPGSRNAPLIVGFTSHDFFTCYSIVDERCAAFFALGMAQQLQKPVALVCTSGSAALNYYPAIAEAFYSDIPLVVLTADRPSHLIDIGDGQTIRQEHVFANHIEYNANCKEGEEFQEYNETEINIALNCAFEKQGPVHINLPFSEPLYGRTDVLSIQPKEIRTNPFEDTIEDKKLQTLAKKWNQSKKKIILIGVLQPNSIEEKYLEILANDDSVIVFTETTSNVHHTHFFPSIDQLISSLTSEEFRNLQPDILVTLGGMIVSKRIKAFLRNYSPKEHWHIGRKEANNTFFALTERIKCSPNHFFESFLPQITAVQTNYQTLWLSIKDHKLQKHVIFEKKAPYSDFLVYQAIFNSIPKTNILQLANSTAIRYAQLFSLDASSQVFCNRGTSGIDGSTSTAIGAAVKSNNPTVFVTGDLSFFYDSNALWNNYIPNTFRIILVNNRGGGIFRILPHAKEVAHFENYFETRHTLTAKHICKMFGFEYATANSLDSVKSQLEDFYTLSENPKLLEIFTPSDVNDIVLKEYFKAIS
ncbi:2-succinyl-5-enolpyruvyl-6-hydroxy-3-cyclohexene-1-carboxylic-acid synthase [Aureisphaera sp. CAU 1614]|uniref:2-succinyl-5-enolpyruvyl-6-hydroxy-3-cyclohexene-1-carboxylate synthase n=1 Tax=Halomarinibacterium sedimenti TaxID=2857106 RepID=A0A9X1FPK3_9FLAO|nr:2-succinyl-5-enolpyruvyl-6-hydroxy-3-cyclohexene-1-carboxylic-acid synthase [Halomarinibacterium sedimenti]MBW2937482.1 2-succinyl-5-enolpyruvyl-6-hydroxy-3-cyclohexene-1-carboxylic-acid synthase [Halomarinibacterium sedimenti]